MIKLRPITTVNQFKTGQTLQMQEYDKYRPITLRVGMVENGDIYLESLKHDYQPDYDAKPIRLKAESLLRNYSVFEFYNERL